MSRDIVKELLVLTWGKKLAEARVSFSEGKNN
jgi:hypothetical protein